MNPIRDKTVNKLAEPVQPAIPSYIDPGSLGPHGIILANIMIMQQGEQDFGQGDPLDALNLGGEEAPNVDMYLNL